MSWPADFNAWLEQGVIAPVFAVVIEGAALAFTTAEVAPGSINPSRPWLDLGSITFGAYGVQPVEWRPESGAWGFALVCGGVGDERRAACVEAIGRGRIVKLKMGRQGQSLRDFVTVAWGRIAGLRDRGQGVLQVEVWDAISALAGRFFGGAELRSEGALFGAYRAPTTVSGTAYTAGDTTLYLAGPPPDGVRQTGGQGLVKVTPASGSQAFYLRWTSVATGPDRLTVTAAGFFGTTMANAAIGSVVEFVPYIYGSPRELALKVLTSTGAGTNGAYDVLPRDWGYALRDGAEIDVADILSVVNDGLSPSSGSDVIEVVADPIPDDGGQWLAGILAPYGAFLTLRQGLITLRSAQDIRPQSRATVRTQRLALTDAQTVPGSVTVQLAEWANVTPGSVAVTDTAGTSSAGSPVRSFPSYPLKTYDVSATGWYNQTAQRDAVLARVKAWAWTLPEVITADFVGLWHWRLAPGDVVEWSALTVGGLYRSTVAGYTARAVMIVRVQPDPLRATVGLNFAPLPDDAADRWED